MGITRWLLLNGSLGRSGFKDRAPGQGVLKPKAFRPIHEHPKEEQHFANSIVNKKVYGNFQVI